MENDGKKICKQLKEIRHQIANDNGIQLEDHECHYEGTCNGTCPRCDTELQYLEKEMVNRGMLAKVALVAGMTFGLAATCQTEGDVMPETYDGDSINPADTIMQSQDKGTAPSEDEAVYYGEE